MACLKANPVRGQAKDARWGDRVPLLGGRSFLYASPKRPAACDGLRTGVGNAGQERRGAGQSIGDERARAVVEFQFAPGVHAG